MGKPKKKKPQSKQELARTILEMIAYIAAIVSAIYQILRG